MKKLYSQDTWRLHSRRRSRHEARRKLKRLKRKQKWINSQRTAGNISYPYAKGSNEIGISAPTDFSLINNTEETLSFFYTIDRFIRKQKNIFLNLSHIKSITPDVILYLLSRLEYNRMLFNRKVRISGKAPIDEKCKKIFMTSGFYDYIYSSLDPHQIANDPNVYSIQSDSKVLGSKAKEASDFAKKQLTPKLDGQKIVYPMIIECMGNTNNHAYKEKYKYRKWWLMASHDPDTKRIHFCFVDNGLGIPNTIRMNWKEHLGRLSQKLFGYEGRNLDDDHLIESALKGEFRTRTKESHRGKGLPRIYRNSQEGKIQNLIILSKRGYVDCATSEKKEFKSEFHGTLLSWTIE